MNLTALFGSPTLTSTEGEFPAWQAQPASAIGAN